MQTTPIPIIDLTAYPLPANISELLTHEYAARYTALPLRAQGGHLWVALSDPHDPAALADLAAVTGFFIVPVQANEQDIRYYISQAYATQAMHGIASQFLVEEKLRTHIAADPALLAQVQAAPAVRFIDSLIEAGVLAGASDIHIEPYGRQMRARYRVDGRLVTHSTVDYSLLQNVISRLKIMGDLNIAERRAPQDGHFNMTVLGEAIDFRISTLPAIGGEKAVLRLLYGSAARLTKDALGFFAEDMAALTHMFHQPYGAVFITGPTGSGKSTTLTAFLEKMNDNARNIVTVEDPVEHPLLGVNHMNIAPAAGLDFAKALKHTLRQDPDVIVVGEIRDTETARIAVQAALTGHVVLSTLHTNDAAGVIERLIDMGVEPYLAASALNGVISQRLVRRLCTFCKEPAVIDPLHAALLHLPADTAVWAAKGCGRCHDTGFRGRVALYEYVAMNEPLRRQMYTNPTQFAHEIRAKHGLRANAIRQMQAGHTTAGEIVYALGREWDTPSAIT